MAGVYCKPNGQMICLLGVLHFPNRLGSPERTSAIPVAKHHHILKHGTGKVSHEVLLCDNWRVFQTQRANDLSIGMLPLTRIAH